MQKTHIHIVKMGGTIEFIDPEYDAINKKLMKLDSKVEIYLQNLIKPHFEFSIEGIVEKDSRKITPEDLEKLSRAITSSAHSNILITHGTYTMNKTAQFLDQQNFSNKKIILTGAMIPLIGFAATDAGFNLGFAISSFASIEPGVYISMNGGIFKSRDIEKNIDHFRFE